MKLYSLMPTRTVAQALAVAAVVLIGAAACARADEASHRAAAEKLLQATGVADQVKLAYSSLRTSMLENFEKSGAPAEARPIFEKYVDDVMELLSGALSWENTKDDYVTVFAAAFSEDEINQLLEFYATPLGQKTLKLLPDLYKKGAEIGQERYRKVKPQLDELTRKMMADVQAISKTKSQTPAPKQ